jgi:hypothetical protein
MYCIRWIMNYQIYCLFFHNSITKHSIHIIYHVLLDCRQRTPVGIALSSSDTSQLCMFDIQATTKSKYCDHIVLLYLESRRSRYRSIICVCFYLYVSVVNLIDYSDIDKMIDIWLCAVVFFHNFYSLKTIFWFFFLSICKSNIPLTSVIMNLK